MKLSKHIHIKTILVIVLLFVGSFSTYATGGEEKEGAVNPGEAKTEVNAGGETDSLKVMVDGSHNQNPLIKQDSLNESVLSFNFIQYIIQRFKFSEEVY